MPFVVNALSPHLLILAPDQIGIQVGHTAGRQFPVDPVREHSRDRHRVVLIVGQDEEVGFYLYRIDFSHWMSPISYKPATLTARQSRVLPSTSLTSGRISDTSCPCACGTDARMSRTSRPS